MGGVASNFFRDLDGDAIAPEAIARAIPAFMANRGPDGLKGGPLRLHHGFWERFLKQSINSLNIPYADQMGMLAAIALPLGRVTEMVVEPDGTTRWRGLLSQANPIAKVIWEMLKEGLVHLGVSVGGKINATRPGRDALGRPCTVICDVRLDELSITDNPANRLIESEAADNGAYIMALAKSLQTTVSPSPVDRFLEQVLDDNLSKAARQKLQEGATKQVNGVTYVLNKKRRWTRAEPRGKRSSQHWGNTLNDSGAPAANPAAKPARKPRAKAAPQQLSLIPDGTPSRVKPKAKKGKQWGATQQPQAPAAVGGAAMGATNLRPKKKTPLPKPTPVGDDDIFAKPKAKAKAKPKRSRKAKNEGGDMPSGSSTLNSTIEKAYDLVERLEKPALNGAFDGKFGTGHGSFGNMSYEEERLWSWLDGVKGKAIDRFLRGQDKETSLEQFEKDIKDDLAIFERMAQSLDAKSSSTNGGDMPPQAKGGDLVMDEHYPDLKKSLIPYIPKTTMAKVNRFLHKALGGSPGGEINSGSWRDTAIPSMGRGLGANSTNKPTGTKPVRLDASSSDTAARGIGGKQPKAQRTYSSGGMPPTDVWGMTVGQLTRELSKCCGMTKDAWGSPETSGFLTNAAHGLVGLTESPHPELINFVRFLQYLNQFAQQIPHMDDYQAAGTVAAMNTDLTKALGDFTETLPADLKGRALRPPGSPGVRGIDIQFPSQYIVYS